MEQERTNEGGLTSGRMLSAVFDLMHALEAILSIWILNSLNGKMFLTSVILQTNFYFLQTSNPVGALNLLKAHCIFTLILSTETAIYALAWISMTLFLEVATKVSHIDSNSIMHAGWYRAIKVIMYLTDLDYVIVILLLIAFKYYHHSQKGREDKFLAATIFWTLKCIFSDEFENISIVLMSCTTSLWMIHKRIYSRNPAVVHQS